MIFFLWIISRPDVDNWNTNLGHTNIISLFYVSEYGQFIYIWTRYEHIYFLRN